MRGLRRGRNKTETEDGRDPDLESQNPPVRTGAVSLVESPLVDPTEPSTEPSTEPRPLAHKVISATKPAGNDSAVVGNPSRLRETISQVATAHAELDNVLPPDSTDAPAPSPRRAATVTISAPVASAAFDGRSGSGPDPAAEPTEDVVNPPDHLASPAVEVEVSGEEAGTISAPEAEEQDAGPDEEAPVPAGDVQSASANPLPRVMAVANQKGGVGKTTTSVNLGAALAELGFRVLVIDLDPQGNATTGLGIDARNFELSMYDVLMRDASLEDCVEPTSMKNLFVAPATIALAGAEIELVPAFSRELKLKRSIEAVIDDFDYILIDCPPSLGLITVNALAAADEVLVPIQCEYYALEGLSQLMRNVHLVASNLNPKLDISTIVLTMYDARTKLADQVASEVRLHFGAKVCRNVIPRTVRLSEAPSFGQPITAFDPASRGAIAYRELAKEVSGGTP
jgi:chromosome partitioning protein